MNILEMNGLKKAEKGQFTSEPLKGCGPDFPNDCFFFICLSGEIKIQFYGKRDLLSLNLLQFCHVFLLL